MIKYRLIRTFSIVVIGVLIGGLFTLYQIKSEEKGSSKTVSVSGNFGGAFSLTNHLGEPVTHKDFEDQYRLIYFGFTYCPAICPTELQKITMAMKDLPSEIEEKISPIFITIDPERDTVQTMKGYVELFHPRMVGLTGTSEQIKQAADAYKVYYARVEDDTMQEYTMDHSSFIYFMGPNDELLRIFKIDDPAEDIATFIQKHFGK